MSLDLAIPRPIARALHGSTAGDGPSFAPSPRQGGPDRCSHRRRAGFGRADGEPLLPGVTVASIAHLLGFVLAVEDNSITELGNQLIRDNFDAAPGDAYKIELTDAGHWSLSDLLGVVPAFMAGCGDGTRQTDGTAFTYSPPAPTRALAAAYATAFRRTQMSLARWPISTRARPSPTVTVVRK
jgi:hypothetical protein